MQTRLASLWESIGGTAIGFIVSVLVWQYIVNPYWNLHTGIIENLQITLLFTVVSVARSYCVRRFFNHMHNKNNKKAAYDQNYWEHGPRKERQG